MDGTWSGDAGSAAAAGGRDQLHVHGLSRSGEGHKGNGDSRRTGDWGRGGHGRGIRGAEIKGWFGRGAEGGIQRDLRNVCENATDGRGHVLVAGANEGA